MTAHSDLLRRAAAKLREHAEAASAQGSAWRLSPNTNNDGHETLVFADADQRHAGIADVIAGSGAGPYVALLHPPVALHLVVLFERSAAAMDGTNDRKRAGRLTEAHLADLMEVVRLAREVLRETEGEAR